MNILFVVKMLGQLFFMIVLTSLTIVCPVEHFHKIGGAKK